MRTEHEIFELIMQFALQDDRIKIVTLEGSRTNKNVSKDKFQDYDITFIVTEMNSYLVNDTWLRYFGNIIMMQKPEDMELYPSEEMGFSYLMMFDDGIKMDLSLVLLEDLEDYLQRDKLVKVLLDKDKIIPYEVVPTDEDYWVKKPSKRSFDDCCNEFWHVSSYVTKGLCRGEILFAIDHLNNILRVELLRMISWKVGIETNFQISVGKNHKYINRYINKNLWNKLLYTYRMDSSLETWNSFFLVLELFREVSKEVAQKLGYEYPIYDYNMTQYIKMQYQIWQLSEEKTKINKV